MVDKSLPTFFLNTERADPGSATAGEGNLARRVQLPTEVKSNTFVLLLLWLLSITVV